MVSSSWWGYITVGLLGAAAGSFFNVVILRTKEQQVWWRGRSHCPHCGHALQWFDMIPVISYIVLRGQCRYCRHDLTRQYVVVEVITTASFMFIYNAFGLAAGTPIGWLLVGSMILLGVYDARWALLPDEFSFLFAVLAVIMSFFMRRPWPDIVLGGLAGTSFFAAQYVLSRRQWVGSGDILLGAGLGLLLGWRLLALALFLAYMVGAIVAASLMLSRRLSASSSIPFGPYLLTAGFASWLWGNQIVNWYFQHAIFR